MHQQGNIALFVIGFVAIIAIIGGVLYFSQSKKIIKAVPEGSNRVIFITPRATPTIEVTPTKEPTPTESEEVTPTKAASATATPTSKPAATNTPKPTEQAASASATPISTE
ncbi:MAG TPA: hypothetical protein VJL83_05920 [Patescibacteria group bacterium]|nr:hypothetical protein [Patescibacteria group bacterium]